MEDRGYLLTQPPQLGSRPYPIHLRARDLPTSSVAAATRTPGRSATALVYSENEFGKIDGKVANGLVRHSGKYDIVGVIDSATAGKDAGELLDGVGNGVRIFESMADAVGKLDYVPEYFVYGIAPLNAFLDQEQRQTIFDAMKLGMNIVNGLPEFLTDDTEFMEKAREYGVQIADIRKPRPRAELHNFSGRIRAVKTPVITVFGTDCAVGKRTTAVKLVEALRHEGLNAVFIATGQTGLLQGSKYGVAVDVLSSGFAAGEVENAVANADEQEHPDIIVVEGQGALSHPAFTSSSSIIKGARPDAVIIQHPPKRKAHCDYPDEPMPTLASEIELIEVFSRSKVIAITINHEHMSDAEVDGTVAEYEHRYGLPTADVLKHGCHKLVRRLLDVFPELCGNGHLAKGDSKFAGRRNAELTRGAPQPVPALPHGQILADEGTRCQLQGSR
jgi:uncharacterized NAD-dependent epimerase/dehydratase family protein